MGHEKRGVPLRVTLEAPFIAHTVIYHRETSLPRRVDERLMGFPTGLPGPCWAAWILEIAVMAERRISPLGDRGAQPHHRLLIRFNCSQEDSRQEVHDFHGAREVTGHKGRGTQGCASNHLF